MEKINELTLIEKLLDIVFTIFIWSTTAFTMNYLIGDKQLDELELTYWFGAVIGYSLARFITPIPIIFMKPKRKSNPNLLDENINEDITNENNN